MAFGVFSSRVHILVVVALVDIACSSVIRAQGSCPYGQFVYQIPPGIYRNADGSDQANNPGVICRYCAMCADGAELVAPCTPTTDTVCGGCVEADHVFDEGTKSCQPRRIIEAVQQLEDDDDDELQSESFSESDYLINIHLKEDEVEDINSSSIEGLFIAASSIFAVVATAAVVLLIICFVAVVIQRQKKSIQGKQKLCNEKKGKINENFIKDEEETDVCPLYTTEPFQMEGNQKIERSNLLNSKSTNTKV